MTETMYPRPSKALADKSMMSGMAGWRGSTRTSIRRIGQPGDSIEAR